MRVRRMVSTDGPIDTSTKSPCQRQLFAATHDSGSGCLKCQSKNQQIQAKDEVTRAKDVVFAAKDDAIAQKDQALKAERELRGPLRITPLLL
ncbi:hypothetical protein EC957_001431 [Mortierella hygrophila]|uniref:Uncharacterized protein n=1 Tax=Mortierella hygrophila TaxID=979708 RepID=A0A9P6K2M1_9FUNG|nr:hypothetical protein EC957_001431 [Mortierella hygrophila]